jgi:hypothetical protein
MSTMDESSLLLFLARTDLEIGMHEPTPGPQLRGGVPSQQQPRATILALALALL